MISKGDKIIFGIIAAGVILIFVFWKDVQAVALGERSVEKIEKEHKEKKKDKKDKQDQSATVVSEVSILQKWELPTELKEVSGIAYMDEQRFACVQDEEGKIFIFNRATGKIEKEIPFAGSGDYEGIALKGNTAYVLRADGVLYEVSMDGAQASAKEHKTALTVEHNVEGLTYDKTNNRLLLAIKDDEPGNRDYKGIYAFDLSKKEFIKEPAFKIDLHNKMLNVADGKKKNKSISPAEIAIHPQTNEIFITDGPKSMLLVMDKSGTIKRLLQLGKDFVQPEGITFSPDGEMFISNEGAKQAGNIMQVEIK
jgi:uncharacterized protein YjiK